MTFDGQHPQAPLSYDIWRVTLRKDCELQGKLPNFENMSEYVLRLLWKDGIDPTVEAVAGSSQKKEEL